MNTFIINVPGAVNDPSLPKLNGFVWTIPPYSGSSPIALDFQGSHPEITLSIYGQGNFCSQDGTTDYGQSITTTGRYVFIAPSTTGYLHIESKYDFSKISAGDIIVNIADLEYSNIDYLVWRTAGIYGSLDKCPNLLNRLTFLYARGNNQNVGIVGQLDNFGNQIEQLDIRYCGGIRGNKSDLGHCISLKYLVIINCTGIEGSLDDLADVMYSNGRVSGTLEVFDVDSTHSIYTFSSSGWTKE